MGPAQADRALGDPNLALRVGHRSSRLFDALPMVPSAGALTGIPLGCQNLALDDDLMFDQSDEPPRTEDTLW